MLEMYFFLRKEFPIHYIILFSSFLFLRMMQIFDILWNYII